VPLLLSPPIPRFEYGVCARSTRVLVVGCDTAEVPAAARGGHCCRWPFIALGTGCVPQLMPRVVLRNCCRNTVFFPQVPTSVYLPRRTSRGHFSNRVQLPVVVSCVHPASCARQEPVYRHAACVRLLCWTAVCGEFVELFAPNWRPSLFGCRNYP
jgi:hypothetical protein